MVELVDTGDLKSPDRKVVRVRVPLSVPDIKLYDIDFNDPDHIEEMLEFRHEFEESQVRVLQEKYLSFVAKHGRGRLRTEKKGKSLRVLYTLYLLPCLFVVMSAFSSQAFMLGVALFLSAFISILILLANIFESEEKQFNIFAMRGAVQKDVWSTLESHLDALYEEMNTHTHLKSTGSIQGATSTAVPSQPTGDSIRRDKSSTNP